MDALGRARCASDSICAAYRADVLHSVGNVTTTRADSLSSSPSVDYLAQLMIELSVTAPDRKKGKRYELTVYHTKTKATWRRALSLNECLEFQSHLLDMMDQGHFCLAECPSLYTFLLHSFPKPMVFGFHGARVMEQRRLALATSMETLRRVLLSACSQSCRVLTEQVAPAFVSFLYGNDSLLGNQQSHPWEQLSPTTEAVRVFGSSGSENEADFGDEHNNQDEGKTVQETKSPIVISARRWNYFKRLSSVDSETHSISLRSTPVSPKHLNITKESYLLTPHSEACTSPSWTDTGIGPVNSNETTRQKFVRNVRTTLSKTNSIRRMPFPPLLQSLCHRVTTGTNGSTAVPRSTVF